MDFISANRFRCENGLKPDNIFSSANLEMSEGGGALSCSLCGEAYEEPRILPCLHSYCSKCIDGLESFIPSDDNNSSSAIKFGHMTATSDTSGYKSSSSSSPSNGSLRRHPNNLGWQVACPTCDTEFKLGRSGASSLPLNYFLQNRVSKARTLCGPDEPVSCEFCMGQVNAVAWCLECGVNLCAFCVEAHKRQRKTNAHHVVTSVTDAQNNSKCHNSLPFCQRHHTEEVTSYCENCATTLCRECVTRGEHRTHRHVAITRDVTEKKIRELEIQLGNMSHASQRFRDALNDVLRVSQMIRTREAEVKEEVNEFYQRYAGALEDHHQFLLSKLTKERDFKLNLLQVQRIQLEQVIHDVDSSRHFAQQLLSEGTPIEILSLVGHVTERMNEVTQSGSYVHTVPNTDGWFQFLPDEQCPQLTGNFQIKGDVTSQRICPSKSHINELGEGPKMAGQRLDITLVSKDREDQSMKRGGHSVKVEVASKDGPKRWRKTGKAIDQCDGTYSLSVLCPEEPGVYMLTIRIQGQHVKGSPFPLMVKAREEGHRGVFHCCSFCSSGGSKLASCGCGGTMPGGFRGCGHGHKGHPDKKHWSCCGSTEEHSKCSIRRLYEATL